MPSDESTIKPVSLPPRPTPRDHVQSWLHAHADTHTPPALDEARQAQVFAELRYELERAIEVFGYDAVYFGVACEVFPDTLDPWAGNEQ